VTLSSQHSLYNWTADLSELAQNVCLLERYAESFVCIYLGGRLHIERVSAGRLRETRLRRSITQLVPEDGPCVFRHRHGADHVHIHLPRPLIARAAAAIGRRTNDLVPQLLANDETVSRLSLLLLEDAEAGGVRGRLYTESVSSALITYLVATYGTGQHPQRWSAPLPGGLLRRVTDYLEAHLKESLSVKELALLVDLSPAHFSALFRRATGLSPYRFLIRLRVSRARQLLESGNDSIGQVAIQVGFYDQSHLTKQMRRVLGISPGRLRRMREHLS
jgi:AraC family transcriptional regulator